MPTYLRVTNLARYQHYKKRNPPWVKLHKRFWTDDKIDQLTVSERLLFLGCLTLASESDNHFRNSPSWITKRIGFPVRTIMIQKLLDLTLLTESTAPPNSVSLSSASRTLSLSKHPASKTLASPKKESAGFESIGSIADRTFPPIES